MWSFLTSFFADGRYNAEVLENILKETFGSQPLFGTKCQRPSGMKIAVTATTISDATLCLFANYNGAGNYNKDFSNFILLLLTIANLKKQRV